MFLKLILLERLLWRSCRDGRDASIEKSECSVLFVSLSSAVTSLSLTRWLVLIEWRSPTALTLLKTETINNYNFCLLPVRTHVYAVRQQLYSCCSRNPIVEQGRAQRGPWLMLSIFLRVRIGMVLVRTEYGVVRTYPHVLLPAATESRTNFP